jgi:hypothetical protein
VPHRGAHRELTIAGEPATARALWRLDPPREPMLLDPNWSFEEAVAEISNVYAPGGYSADQTSSSWNRLTSPLRQIDRLRRAYDSP